MINKLQSSKSKTKLKFYENMSKYYDNMSIRRNEVPFTKNAQGISKLYHEVLLLMKFLQTKPEVKSKSFNNYDLYYTVIKNRGEKETVNN